MKSETFNSVLDFVAVVCMRQCEHSWNPWRSSPCGLLVNHSVLFWEEFSW